MGNHVQLKLKFFQKDLSLMHASKNELRTSNSGANKRIKLCLTLL